jgi:hypothetical protein
MGEPDPAGHANEQWTQQRMLAVKRNDRSHADHEPGPDHRPVGHLNRPILAIDHERGEEAEHGPARPTFGRGENSGRRNRYEEQGNSEDTEPDRASHDLNFSAVIGRRERNGKAAGKSLPQSNTRSTGKQQSNKAATHRGNPDSNLLHKNSPLRHALRRSR